MVVTPSKGNKIPFKQDTGLCKGIPYIDARKFKEGSVVIETVRKNFKKFTKEEIEMAKLSRETQAMIGHPQDSVFKKIAGDGNPKNCLVKTNNLSPANSIFGSNCDNLEGASTSQNPKWTKVEFMR